MIAVSAPGTALGAAHEAKTAIMNPLHQHGKHSGAAVRDLARLGVTDMPLRWSTTGVAGVGAWAGFMAGVGWWLWSERSRRSSRSLKVLRFHAVLPAKCMTA
jgi:hypothetical protein